jgi:hypothetical protein
MNTTPTLVTNVVTGTVPVAERREAERFACRHSPLLQAVVRPSFAPVTVIVDDVSTKGIGLFCDEPIEPGVRIAVLWMCGQQQQWQTIRARVTRAAPCHKGGWVIGCVFDEHLQPGDVLALVGYERTPTMTGLRDISDASIPEAEPCDKSAKNQADRRSAIRKPAREHIRVQCRRASLGSGTNLATRLVDIAEGGVQLVARERLVLREEVEIVLDGDGVQMPIQRMSVVRWVVPVDGGGCCVGVQFATPLGMREVQTLTNP